MILTPSAIGDLILLAILFLIGWHSYRLWVRGRWLAFDPLNTFWAGVVVCYIHQPISHGDLYVSWHDIDVFDKTLFWILFGLVFVVIGYEGRWGQMWGKRFPAMPQKIAPRRLELAGYIFIVLGLVGYTYLIRSAGGIYDWLGVARGGTEWESVSAYVALLEHMLPLGISLLLFRVCLHRASLLKKVAFWAIGALMWVWFVYLGSRARTIAFTMMMLAAYYLPRRKNPPLSAMAAGFVVLLVLVGFQTQYRDHFTNLSLNLDQIDMEEAMKFSLPAWMGGGKESPTAETSPGAEFNCVMTVIELVPGRIDFNYGYSHLELFTRPIPRSIWPEKIYPHAEAFTPIMDAGGLSDAWVPTSQRPVLMGPAFTFAGHWYAVGGGLALMIAGLLTGCLLRAIRTVLDRAPDGEGNILLFSNLMMIGFWEAASTPLNWIYSLPFILAPLLLTIYLSASPKSLSGPSFA